MIEIDFNGWKNLRLSTLVLDVNGTLTLDGELLDGVAERIELLSQKLEVHLLSADTHGKLSEIAGRLRVASTKLTPGGSEAEQKARFVRTLGASGVVAIGNGANDAGMLDEAELGIAVLGGEGLATVAMVRADVVVSTVQDALDLLLTPKRLVATLRR